MQIVPYSGSPSKTQEVPPSSGSTAGASTEAAGQAAGIFAQSNVAPRPSPGVTNNGSLTINGGAPVVNIGGHMGSVNAYRSTGPAGSSSGQYAI